MNIECRIFLYRFFGIIFFFCQHPAANCQFDSAGASLRVKPKIIGGFATKTSFIDGFRSPIFSAYIGMDFNNHIRFGVGASWLKLPSYIPGRNNKPFYSDKIVFTASGNSDTVHPALSFSYIHILGEYIFFRTEKWQFSMPMKFGAGQSEYTYWFEEKFFSEHKRFILLYESSVSGHYKILKWLGAGLEVGYRLMLVNNKTIGSSFNSPVYDARTIIFWGELYKQIKRK